MTLLRPGETCGRLIAAPTTMWKSRSGLASFWPACAPRCARVDALGLQLGRSALAMSKSISTRGSPQGLCA